MSDDLHGGDPAELFANRPADPAQGVGGNQDFDSLAFRVFPGLLADRDFIPSVITGMFTNRDQLDARSLQGFPEFQGGLSAVRSNHHMFYAQFLGPFLNRLNDPFRIPGSSPGEIDDILGHHIRSLHLPCGMKIILF